MKDCAIPTEAENINRGDPREGELFMVFSLFVFANHTIR